MPLIAIALVAALAIGGGVSIAAQSALPGNMLYPVKVNVDENVQGAFALNDAARADWDIKAIDQRLTEAQVLAAQGSLDANAQTEISNNFDTHNYDVGKIIAKLQASGDNTDAAKIAAKLQGVLTAHASLIASASTEQSAETQASLVPIVGDLQGALDAAGILTDRAQKAASSSNGAASSDTSASVTASTSVKSGVRLNL